MEVVKKNMFSIVLGVIALLAVVAIFYPIGGLFDNLKKEVGQEASLFNKAKQTYTAPHQLPITDSGDSSSTEPKPLGVFPMPKITKAAEECVAALNGQSDSLVKAAEDINKAECIVRPDQKYPDQMLLVSGSLPQPGAGSSADAEFKKALDPEIDHLRKVLDAATPPTSEDLDKAKAALKKTYDQKKFFTGANGNANGGQAINGAEVDAAEQEAELKLPLQMRDQTALNHHMYMDATAIVSPTEIVGSPQPPAPDSMYYAQAAIWMQEDICRAIAEVNAKSPNIMQSPVKRMVSLTIPFGINMFVRPPAAQGQTGPEGGLGGPNNTGPRAYYSLSPTGRTANGLYDVVSGILVVHVDATRVPDFLAALNHNRLMSVRNMSVSRVDTAGLLDQGYMYGEAPVAELKLDIEQLQLRSWTTPLMPAKVATLLGADGKTDYLAQAPQPPVTGTAGVGESMNPNAPTAAPGAGAGGFGAGGAVHNGH